MYSVTLDEIRHKAEPWVEGGHGLAGAVRRLADAHLSPNPEPRLDARDRSALAFIMAQMVEAGLLLPVDIASAQPSEGPPRE